MTIALGIALVLILVVTRINLGKQLTSFEKTSVQFFTNTQATLDLFEGSIPDLSNTLTGINDTLEDFESSSAKLPALLENVGNLIGSDFVSIAEEGKSSLESAASSAKIIDETLAFLSRVPLLNISYDPDQPLGLGLSQLSENFGSITPGLEQIESDLGEATQNLGSLSENLQGITKSLTSFNDRLLGLKPLTLEYRLALKTLESDVSQSIRSLQRNLTILLVVLILIILLWLFNQSLGYFASFSPVSGKISDEQHRSEVPALGDEIVSNQSNQRSE